jgi:DDE superfamily endonuclease
MVVGADRVNIEVFSLALAHFAQAVSAGSDRHVVLVLDRAGWHKSGEVLMPEGIHLLFLPPYSPELQPCEHLWPLTNEVIANRRFESLDELRRGCKPSGVSFFRTIHSVFVGTRFSTGGLSQVTQSRPEPEAASGWLTRQHIAALRLDLDTWVGAALSTLLNHIARLAQIAFHLSALKEGKIERDLLAP